MKCETCKYQSQNFCAVNPTHYKSRFSKACREYEHDASKEQVQSICGNCMGMFMGECSLTGVSVDASDKGCMDFMTQQDLDDEMAGEEDYNQYKYKLLLKELKVKFSLESNGKLKEIVLLK